LPRELLEVSVLARREGFTVYVFVRLTSLSGVSSLATFSSLTVDITVLNFVELEDGKR